MTLEENQKICLGLIEEYSPKNPLLTDDEDIQTRLNLLYAPSYEELAEKHKIVKSRQYNAIPENEEMYTPFSLPTDFYEIKSILALNNNNAPTDIEYYLLAKKIYIKCKSDSKCFLEYYAYPTVITEKTLKDFNLEIEQDVQMILPYAVASDILKVDPSADYIAFEKAYQRKLSELEMNKQNKEMVVTLERKYNLDFI